MKNIILIITVFLLCCCGKKSENKKLSDDVILSKTNNHISASNNLKISNNANTKNAKLYSPNEILSNANIFRESIKLKENPLLDGIYIPKLTMKQAKFLLINGTSQWFNIASKISSKCRNFGAGNYFLKSVYEARRKNKCVAPIGAEWGNFLMRHGKGKEAVKIFNMAINESIDNKEIPSTIAQLYIDRTAVYNMMRDFKEALNSAEETFNYVSKNEENNDMKYKYIYGTYLYLQELYNNQEYDKALKFYEKNKVGLNTPEGKSWNMEGAIVSDIRKKRNNKSVLSHGYGVLSK